MAASALDFVPIGTTAETLPANLTEDRFRHFWEQADKSRGAALAVARSTRLSMPAPRSVEIVTQSACGIVFASAVTCRLAQQIGRPSMLAICDACHSFSSLSGYVYRQYVEYCIHQCAGCGS